jgi:hypothetical protein
LEHTIPCSGATQLHGNCLVDLTNVSSISNMTSLCYLTLKEMPLIRHHENQARKCVGNHPDFVNVLKGPCFYRAKKHLREDLILPELLPDNLSDVPENIFQ